MAQRIKDCTGVRVIFDYRERPESASGALPSSAQQEQFEGVFAAQIADVHQWSIDQGWPLSPLPFLAHAGPDKAQFDLHVFVSEEYRISRALVPAWAGASGRMEFPAQRVVAEEASIAHELVHVFYPNGNRMLAEGLAVYLQAVIGRNDSFPNFGMALHDMAKDIAQGRGTLPSAPDPVAASIVEFDAIATPDHLQLASWPTLRFKQTYVLAGSFVQFLIEDVEHGQTSKFRKLYGTTPLQPSKRDAGGAERWRGAYQRALIDLAEEWRSLIAAR